MDDVIVFGSLNMDLVVNMERLPIQGETINGTDLSRFPGGKGANQAVGIARLGLNSFMVGRVGNDDFGKNMFNSLANENVDVSGISQDILESTGTAIIYVDSNGDNTIVAVYGSNMKCGSREIDFTIEKKPDSDLLMLQNEIPAITSIDIATRWSELGGRIIWDPAPASEKHLPLLNVCDFVTPNEVEVSSLSNTRVTNIESAKKACMEIASVGTAVPIIKLGGQGVVYMDGSKVIHQPAFKVNVLDTVAAGDAFNAGFATALNEGKNLPDSVRFGCGVGALATMKRGAQSAMPYREEVERFLETRVS